MTQPKYDESVKSRFEDIKRDGPNIYTGLLENTDNSIDWGEADEIEIIHNRESITIKDNGKNGFGSIEALERFFTIGQKNEENVTEKTIGKYGKGGYKATISMGNRVEITTYFDGNEYTYGTSFIDMEEHNTMEPTMKMTVKKNESGEVGSKIKVLLRHEIGLIYNSEEAMRHFIRAYHNYGKDIKFSLKSTARNEILEFNPNEHSPYRNIQKERPYYVYYQEDGDKFIHNMNDTGDSVMEINAFILQERITNNKLLTGGAGSRKPGIDFYRCGRMCNTRYPIFNIGDVGHNITAGQMRGMRCHIICKFVDTNISDLMSMDDYIGVTTVKDIYEDDRMNQALIEILEEISKDTSLMYETLISDQKNSFNKHISTIGKTITNMSKMEDDILLEDTYPLKETYDDLANYTTFQVYYFDTDKLQFVYCKSKVEAKAKSSSGEGTKCTKSNAIYKNIRDNIIPSIKKLQEKKNTLEEKEIKIQEIMVEHTINRKEAKLKYVENLRKLNAEAAEERRKKHLDNLLNNAYANHQSTNYDEAIRLYEEYVETKDGECDEITSLIETIKEEQVCNLKEGINIEIENKNYDIAMEYTHDIIDIDESYTEEIEQIQDNINTLNIKNKCDTAEETEKNGQYDISIKIYQTLLDEYDFNEEENKEIETKMRTVEKSAIQSYENEIEKSIGIDSFKKAKEYSACIEEINPEKADEMVKRIEESEKVYETRIKKITTKDVDNLYKNIMKECKTDEDIQKIFKDLGHFHNKK